MSIDELDSLYHELNWLTARENLVRKELKTICQRKAFLLKLEERYRLEKEKHESNISSNKILLQSEEVQNDSEGDNVVEVSESNKDSGEVS